MKLTFKPRAVITAVILIEVFTIACGGRSALMSGPSGTARSGTMLLSVTPIGGAVGVPTGSSMALRLSAPMARGMEAFMDLHEGGLDGHVAPWRCNLSPDRTNLTCLPVSPLRSHASYTLHIGGGMMDTDGHFIDMDEYRGSMGGEWIQGGMMGPSHDTNPWGMMAGGWQGMNGSYGMAFPFTTD